MNDYRCFYQQESLSQDPVLGYISFSSDEDDLASALSKKTADYSERDLIDSVPVQRLRHIHQLQTAWLVYPTAEHSRFSHVLGTMDMASRVWRRFSPSFMKVFSESGETPSEKLPSEAYLESLLRVAGLLHDVGHGPFGHFFDAHFLNRYQTKDGRPLTHESLGAEIIRQRLGDIIRGIRRSPGGALENGESLDPEQVAFLIVRPQTEEEDHPAWLRALRSLFSGIYTVDNMDFVLRDAFMTGFSAKAFDLERLLRYSFFTPRGLTVHKKGLSALTRFIAVRAELFRSVYFHRTVRAIDLQLADLFRDSVDLLFPSGNPLDHLDDYFRLTEWSLLVDVARWGESGDPRKERLAPLWDDFLNRRLRWHLVAEKTILHRPGDRSASSVFSGTSIFEAALRANLPTEIRDIPLNFDVARHIHRPGANLPSAGQNFLFDPLTGAVTPLEAEELYRSIPECYRICRVYAETRDHQQEIAAALERLVSTDDEDDLTNM